MWSWASSPRDALKTPAARTPVPACRRATPSSAPARCARRPAGAAAPARRADARCICTAVPAPPDRAPTPTRWRADRSHRGAPAAPRATSRSACRVRRRAAALAPPRVGPAPRAPAPRPRRSPPARGLVHEPIRRPHRLVARLQAVAHQQPLHSLADLRQRCRHFGVARPRRRVKCQPAPRVVGEHAVQHEGVKMDVDVQRPTRALHRRHHPRLHTGNAARARVAPVHVAQRARVHAQHRAAQPVIPRQLVAQPIRQRQHPLALRHPTAAPCPPGAPPAPSSAGPRSSDTTPFLCTKTAGDGRARSPRTETAPRRPRTPRRAGTRAIALHELREPRAVARLRHRAQERLQMLGDHLVQHGVLGVARAIRGRATFHAFWGSAPAPPCLCHKMDTPVLVGAGTLLRERSCARSGRSSAPRASASRRPARRRQRPCHACLLTPSSRGGAASRTPRAASS